MCYLLSEIPEPANERNKAGSSERPGAPWLLVMSLPRAICRRPIPSRRAGHQVGPKWS